MEHNYRCDISATSSCGCSYLSPALHAWSRSLHHSTQHVDTVCQQHSVSALLIYYNLNSEHELYFCKAGLLHALHCTSSMIYRECWLLLMLTDWVRWVLSVLQILDWASIVNPTHMLHLNKFINLISNDSLDYILIRL